MMSVWRSEGDIQTESLSGEIMRDCIVFLFAVSIPETN
jgi:hypothetical protein